MVPFALLTVASGCCHMSSAFFKTAWELAGRLRCVIEWPASTFPFCSLALVTGASAPVTSESYSTSLPLLALAYSVNCDLPVHAIARCFALLEEGCSNYAHATSVSPALVM